MIMVIDLPNKKLEKKPRQMAMTCHPSFEEQIEH
jgi:hypothetical protein